MRPPKRESDAATYWVPPRRTDESGGFLQTPDGGWVNIHAIAAVIVGFSEASADMQGAWVVTTAGTTVRFGDFATIEECDETVARWLYHAMCVRDGLGPDVLAEGQRAVWHGPVACES